MIKFVLASAAVAIFAAPVLAQVITPQATPPLPAAEDTFIKHDADGDGALSTVEAKSADAKITQPDFDKYDGDKSQSLSKDEFAKWVEANTTPPASAPG